MEGKSSRLIAQLLAIIKNTVRQHLQHNFAKLEVENRGMAIRRLLAE